MYCYILWILISIYTEPNLKTSSKLKRTKSWSKGHRTLGGIWLCNTSAPPAIRSHGSLTVEAPGWMIRGKLDRECQNIKSKENRKKIRVYCDFTEMYISVWFSYILLSYIVNERLSGSLNSIQITSKEHIQFPKYHPKWVPVIYQFMRLLSKT